MKSEIDQPTPTTLIRSIGLPPDQSPIQGRALARSRRQPRRVPANFILSPTAPAVTPLPRPTSSIRKTAARLRTMESDQRSDQKDQAAEGQTPPMPQAVAAPLRRRAERLRAITQTTHRRRIAQTPPPLHEREIPPLSSAPIFGVATGGSQSIALSRGMTGFARGHGVSGSYAWAWEIKSVNEQGPRRPASTALRLGCDRRAGSREGGTKRRPLASICSRRSKTDTRSRRLRPASIQSGATNSLLMLAGMIVTALILCFAWSCWLLGAISPGRSLR